MFGSIRQRTYKLSIGYKQVKSSVQRERKRMKIGISSTAAAMTHKIIDNGLANRILGSPSEIASARRKFCSINSASTKPRMIGAVGKSSLRKMYPKIPSTTISTSESTSPGPNACGKELADGRSGSRTANRGA